MSEDHVRLRHHLDAVLATGLGWMRRRRWLPLIFGGFNTFAVIALGVGSGMGGDLEPAVGPGILTLKGVVIFAAAIVALVSNFLALVVGDPGSELLGRAANLEGEARAFLDQRDDLNAKLAEQSALDTRRLALIDASAAMLEACENMLAYADLTLEVAIDTTLRTGRRPIVSAIDFGREEYWAISIFRVDGDELSRVVSLRADPMDEQLAGRSWRRGEGFVGMAWLRDSEVIIADGRQAEIAAAYVVPEDKRVETDNVRYRSMAVVPIRAGLRDEFWGVVAVSSDCPDRFRVAPGNDRVKNVDTVRLIANTIELLIAGFARGAE